MRQVMTIQTCLPAEIWSQNHGRALQIDTEKQKLSQNLSQNVVLFRTVKPSTRFSLLYVSRISEVFAGMQRFTINE